MNFRQHWFAAAAFCIAASCAQAQSWPTKPIRAIVPFPPGSGTDTIARPVLAQMSKQLGQPIVVENKPGAGGTIGMAAVASAEPDGYTILIHSNSFTVVPATYTNLTFDPVKDFTGIMPLASLPMALVVAPSSGYKSVKDLVAAAKAKPNSINYASAGAGGATHLGAERFRLAAGIEGTHVPYKGSGEAMTDVMTARVDYYFSPVGLALPLIKAGKLSALAVSSSKRSTGLPDVPTTLEAGLPNSDYNVWIGMWVSAKTPRPIVQKLHDELAKAIQSPEVQETFRTLVADSMVMSLEQFDAMQKSDVAMNTALVKAAKVTVNYVDILQHAEAFRAEVCEFCARDLPRELTHKVVRNMVLEKDDYLRYLQLLARKGWSVGHWPREHGGCDWTPLQRFVFDEETSRAGAPWLIPFGVNYVGPVIYTYGSDEQKRRFLPPIRASSEWWAQGYSEPGAGSDLAALRTRAVRDGSHYVVTGQKIWTTYAQWADWMFCLVRTQESDRLQNGISFLLVDMKAPGVTVRPIATMDMYHHVNEVFLDEVRVPVENLVGEEGKGWTYAKFLLANERVLVSEVGRSTRQLQRLQALAARTMRDGRPLREDSVFARRLADLDLRLYVLQRTCYRAVAQTMQGTDAGAAASIMKLRGSELQQDIAEAMVDALGLAGIVFDPRTVIDPERASPVGDADAPGIVRDHLHGRAATIYGGSNEIQRNIIAKAALGL